MDVEKLSKEIQDVVPAPSIKHAVSSDAEDTMVNDAAQSEQATAIHLSCIGWRPSKQEWMIFAPLMVISVMVSLDATIIITPLPVRSHASSPIPPGGADHANCALDHRPGSPCQRHCESVGGNILSTRVRGDDVFRRVTE